MMSKEDLYIRLRKTCFLRNLLLQLLFQFLYQDGHQTGTKTENVGLYQHVTVRVQKLK
jgi:hypothetical protein